MSALQELQSARKHLDAGNPDDAWEIVDRILTDDPNDPRALLMGTHIQEGSRRLSIAYQMAERGVRLAPNISEMWVNFGRLSDLLYRYDDAEKAYHQALELSRNPDQRVRVLGNIGAFYVSAGRWKEAEEVCRKALAMDPNFKKGKCNLGIALLAQKQWVEGWANYSTYLGTPHRKLIQYGSELEWDNTKGKSIVIYGEQGIGDEILLASMIPEAMADSKKVVIDCDKRLKGLFQRSFPSAKVYGTRFVNAETMQPSDLWSEEDRIFDASISMGELGKFYRKSDEDFKVGKFLEADSIRTGMWKAHFKRKPVIGIAWSGGVQWTGAKYRKFNLEDMLPLFRTVDANWVSLQYKDAAQEIKEFEDKTSGIAIQQFPFATLTKDYDDTAALVAACDLVIAPPTAVVHLAGALGVPCIAMRAKFDCWKFAAGLPFHKSVTLVEHEGGWPQTIESVAKMVRKMFPKILVASA